MRECYAGCSNVIWLNAGPRVYIKIAERLMLNIGHVLNLALRLFALKGCLSVKSVGTHFVFPIWSPLHPVPLGLDEERGSQVRGLWHPARNVPAGWRYRRPSACMNAMQNVQT